MSSAQVSAILEDVLNPRGYKNTTVAQHRSFWGSLELELVT